ncbi:MAG: ATP-dependent DNA helicase RecG [Planctomycetota bacterium]|nr:ATP-dependent DNA helicase RecG [Planctomycetota bacterium]
MKNIELRPSTPIEAFPGVGPQVGQSFRHLGLATAGDLLRHFPMRYEHDRGERTVAELIELCERGESPVAALRVEVASVRHTPRPKPRSEATFEDDTGTVRAVWFHAPWMRQKLHPGGKGVIQGQAKLRGKYLELTNPRWEPEGAVEAAPRSERLRPIYPASEEIGSAQIERAMVPALAGLLSQVEDPLPAEYRASRALPPLSECYRRMHAPVDMDEQREARRRLAFEELLLLQLGVMMKKRQMREGAKAPSVPVTAAVDARIRSRFPFVFTSEQDRACAEIAGDIAGVIPMNRLLQGDVGSGKTAVALYGMLAAVAAGGQAAIVAPTELLAEQHGASISRFLAGSDVRVELLTGSLGAAARRAALERIASGESQIAVGTHALLLEGAVFRNLSLAVIDEQHRFGVEQRAAMRAKVARATGEVPHILVMTATPIPRTLSLTVFGDLDVSVIRTRPAGRQPVTTKVVGRDKETEVYAYLRTRIDGGEQCYVVVPAVEESATGLKDADGTARALSAGVFAGLRIGVVHGQLARDDREATMDAFRRGEIDVLVATVVIEVGVDVANASLMVIEHADRFGLAQLHQLRGRVGRGERKSLCVFIGEPITDDARKRLDAISGTDDGFEIAELDLAIRGPGELFGSRQSGLPPFKVADLVHDMELLRLARRDAKDWIERDGDLSAPEHRLLRRKLMHSYGGALGLADVA